jgi:uncharacterized DUF497 family protein
MRLIWHPRNIEKVEAHAVTVAEVEAVFDASDWATRDAELPYRHLGEGTTPEGRVLRVIFVDTEDGFMPITAFPIRHRPRRTP